jgi:NAD(P)-dependent dehydrogenase (short-subunit alcohol dehydrogenase family)
VVNLAGMYHRRGVIDVGDLDWERRPWDRAAANAAVQLARVMFTFELARRFPEITANAVHPGAVLTEALKQAPFALRVLAHTLARPAFVKPDQGAAPVVRLADDPALEGITGRWFDRYTDAEPAAAALDPDLRVRLWAAAEQATSAR